MNTPKKPAKTIVSVGKKGERTCRKFKRLPFEANETFQELQQNVEINVNLVYKALKGTLLFGGW